MSWDHPLKPTGGLAILRGNLAPEGCVVKLAGHERLHHRGPARVFDSEEACFAAVKARAIVPGDVVVIRYEGPAGGPGMREMLHVTASLVGEGLGDEVALITDGRFSRRDPRADGRSRRAGGVPRRADRARARRRLDRRRRREPASSCSTSPDDELARRAAEWVQPAPRYDARRLREVRGDGRLGFRGSDDSVSSGAVEQLLDRAGRLADPLLVLDEGEADVAVAARPEADAGADRDAGLLRQAQRDVEGAERAELLGNRRPDEHRPERRLDGPARPGEPVAERVAAAAVDLADLDGVVGRLAERDRGRDLDGLERPVVEVRLQLREGGDDLRAADDEADRQPAIEKDFVRL